MTELVENPPQIPRKPGHRLVGRLLVGVARLVFLAAAALLITGLILLVAWWRLLSWPQRHLTRQERAAAQREALLQLVQAAGVLLAIRR